MNALPPSDIATQPVSHVRFEPEAVLDLLRPIEAIIETVAHDFHGQDLLQSETRRHFVVAVDRVLLAREPWSHVVPPTLREGLVVRLLRSYWWGQGGVLEPVAGAA